MLIVSRWLWARRSVGARFARLLLVPPSLAYRVGVATRTRLYRTGILRRTVLPAPTVAVGNLTVGGSGKTPLAVWIASYYAGRGRVPGILLRGYGGDEGAVHRELVPGAVVVESVDRRVGAAQAVARGADVLVLDDAFQRLDVVPDLNIAVVSAESMRAVRWLLPAGPWREPWVALERADVVVVTRKRADRVTAARAADRVATVVPADRIAIARLGIVGFRGMLTGTRLPPDTVAGRRVLVSAGVGDPDSLAAQCAALGASVRLLAWPDHHAYRSADVARVFRAQALVDYVVVTAKDAVKLGGAWPSRGPEPLVADLDVEWERGYAMIRTALDAAAATTTELLTDPSPEPA